MKLRRSRMLKAWRIPLPVFQRFVATKLMGATQIGLLKVGDVFTMAGVYQHRPACRRWRT